MLLTIIWWNQSCFISNFSFPPWASTLHMKILISVFIHNIIFRFLLLTINYILINVQWGGDINTITGNGLAQWWEYLFLPLCSSLFSFLIKNSTWPYALIKSKLQQFSTTPPPYLANLRHWTIFFAHRVGNLMVKAFPGWGIDLCPGDVGKIEQVKMIFYGAAKVANGYL